MTAGKKYCGSELLQCNDSLLGLKSIFRFMLLKRFRINYQPYAAFSKITKRRKQDSHALGCNEWAFYNCSTVSFL